MNKEFTYKNAGVDLDIAYETKKELAKYVSSADPRILNQLGPFASLFEAKFPDIEHPVLVLKAEEPGSKQLLAVKHNRIEGIGFDMINHLINDIIVMGAKPLAVLDTIVCGKLEKDVIVKIVKSIAQACREQNCNLVGGEISEQPGVLSPGTYVLAASIVGVVEKSKIIDGSRIEEGDSILAVASNGLHTNGYSLVRKLIEHNQSTINERVGEETFLNAIFKPHKCYYKPFKEIIDDSNLHGLAHITGGGIQGNLNRILPEGLSASIDLNKIKILPIFKVIKETGDVPDSDMIRTFNMGVGMNLVVHPSGVEKIQGILSAQNCYSYNIGNIIKGNQTVEFSGGIMW